jgi:hypothetical protein
VQCRHPAGYLQRPPVALLWSPLCSTVALQDVTATCRNSFGVDLVCCAVRFPYKRGKEITAGKLAINTDDDVDDVEDGGGIVVGSTLPPQDARATNRPGINADSGLGRVEVWCAVQPPYRIDFLPGTSTDVSGFQYTRSIRVWGYRSYRLLGVSLVVRSPPALMIWETSIGPIDSSNHF